MQTSEIFTDSGLGYISCFVLLITGGRTLTWGRMPTLPDQCSISGDIPLLARAKAGRGPRLDILLSRSSSR